MVLIVLGTIFLLQQKAKPIDSIAVLPFGSVNLGPESAYFSKGITESLISKFSELPTLKKVISSFSVARYKGQPIDPKKVGTELDVRALLTGKIVQRQEGLSVNVELVDTRDNSVIWSGRYDKQQADIVSLQKEISMEITEKLRLRLTGKEKKDWLKAPQRTPKPTRPISTAAFFGTRGLKKDC